MHAPIEQQRYNVRIRQPYVQYLQAYCMVVVWRCCVFEPATSAPIEQPGDDVRVRRAHRLRTDRRPRPEPEPRPQPRVRRRRAAALALLKGYAYDHRCH